MDYSCDYCNISFKRNCDLTRYKNTIKCKDKRNNNMITNNNKSVINDIEKEMLTLKIQISQLTNKLEINENIKNKIQESLSQVIKENTELKNDIKLLIKENEILKKIVENSSVKTTNINYNNYTNTMYNYYLSNEDKLVNFS